MYFLFLIIAMHIEPSNSGMIVMIKIPCWDSKLNVLPHFHAIYPKKKKRAGGRKEKKKKRKKGGEMEDWFGRILQEPSFSKCALTNR